ncbi:flavin reductase family protein [Mesorhizobium sp. M7A.F.Ca.CA.001.09.2.1]|jgi:flavin reductase (DIM6/NTAB) family NADH-FMN oxidoreductase RutF|uniref:Flavin reductase family protein n=1 Tax=Mesorhizobium ciceri TaxID=39645 RepID=A0AB38TIU3_9HYPH|nr:MULTISPECIES: flavin reductase family protein [Mesorhizobium]RUU14134.1 flavin reductase family protein [Mesorhizobium sp. M7A.T.Ca.TU.009.01.3.2]RUV10658.1 flavin reductase family protein [Mesorhizobium sp. M7A.T.Ca.TU.009.01.3.1]RUV50683.1 flavin reductase family protein [Mesorhizobium sp. M7A.F.Ca.MR.228.00.0.0]RUY58989.1 flavin reductase family protein [Mesorhizobium sp. M7A.F.Ca.CA.001.13.2.1]RVB45074.1 flavin reductase family protein [Mesorhizobium sp. M7A.F.Ca.CA.004.05.1.1]
MQFDFSELKPLDRHKLLSSTITPRPIAWVTTVASDGVRNAAPFSFFNVFSEDPPVVGFSIVDRSAGDNKDTGRNIRMSGQFVVNLVDEDRLDQMNITAAEFAPEIDEFSRSGLAEEASVTIAAPRIAESPVSMECVLHSIVPLGVSRSLILGTVQMMHIRDDMLIDPVRFHVDTQKLRLVARAQGNTYVRTTDAFELPRISAT